MTINCDQDVSLEKLDAAPSYAAYGLPSVLPSSLPSDPLEANKLWKGLLGLDQDKSKWMVNTANDYATARELRKRTAACINTLRK
jgi:hypothetical protein